MITTMLETSSRVDVLEANLLTRGVRDDAWLLPEIEHVSDSAGETTTERCASRLSDGSATAMPGDGQKFTKPVQRDDLVIHFPSDHVKLLQQWECVVLNVHDDCVECEMHDLSDESQPVEWAEVCLEEFNRFDRPLLCEGAVFYWSIGHETRRTGQVRRYSELRVRRMPQLSQSQRREISERAKRLGELLHANL